MGGAGCIWEVEKGEEGMRGSEEGLFRNPGNTSEVKRDI